MRIFAVIPAAGIGTRMGSDIPKQYLDLGGQSVLSRTLHRIAEINGIDEIVVVLHPKDTWFSKDVLSMQKPVQTVDGGKDRQDSVRNALIQLSKKAESDDWVLIHDAARPLVSVEDINTLIATVKDDDIGGILATPVTDTLKQSDDKSHIVTTVDRSMIWRALTPQMFRFGLLFEALQTVQTVTDEAQAIEMLGYQSLLVEGNKNNIKITTPEDLVYAEWMLEKNPV